MGSYERDLSILYLRNRERAGFLSVMGWITIVGILVGVMALVVALSFASGFQSALRDKIIGVNAHLLVLRYDGGMEGWKEVLEKIRQMPGVDRIMPFTYQQAMARSEDGVAGTVVRGVVPEEIPEISGMQIAFACGGVSAGSTPGENEPSGTVKAAHDEESIWLGKALAETLEVTCGDSVKLVALSDPSGEEGGARLRSYRLAGIFEVGMYEYDASLAFLSLSEAQDFFELGDRVTGLEIRLEDIGLTDTIETEIARTLGYPYWVKNWREINPNFFSALKLQKVVMFVILTLIILVGGFNIISTLIMSVIEKRRQIAILKAMGATRRSIGRIFFYQGLTLGCMGTGLGLAGGYALCRISGVLPFRRLDPDVYYLSYLPVEMRPLEFLMVGGAALILVLLSTIYPARQAARLDPSEVLRYE